MSLDYYVIEFPLKTGLDPVTIPFVPFGTRTLKMRFTNPDWVRDNLVVRSEHTPAQWGKSAFYTLEDGGDDFNVSWGGGHEEGSCVSGQDMVKEVAGKEIKVPFEACGPLINRTHSFVYLNITHRKGDWNKSRTITLGVRPEGQSGSDAMFTLTLNLVPPTGIDDPVRLVETSKGSLQVQGTQAADYIGRWWAQKDVTYPTDQSKLPKLSVKTDKDDLKIYLDTGSEQKLIIEYRDAVKFQAIGQGNSFDLDVYHFVAHYYAVRLWFFWIDKDGLRTVGQEIPDVERFDFIVDTQENKVVFVATDTHWRESWTCGPESDEPVRAQIGLFSSDVVGGMPWEEKRNHDNFIDWMLTHKSGKDDEDAPPNIPSTVVMNTLDPKAMPGVLGVGPEAHVPYFINCPAPESEEYIASDPRYG